MIRYSRQAFTLIELLVVVTIIGVLAGIALPVISSVQLTARKTQSLSNMRQLGAATLAYCGDNGGSLPQQGDATSWGSAATNTTAENSQWYNAVPRAYANSPNLSEYAVNQAAFYTKGSMFYVPAAVYPANKLSAPQFAIAFNSKLITGSVLNVRLQLIQDPSETVLYQEAGVVGEKTIVGTSQKAYTTQSYSYASRTAARYSGQTILTFCDGHAATFAGTDVVAPDGKAYFPPKPTASVYWSEDPTVNPGS